MINALFVFPYSLFFSEESVLPITPFWLLWALTAEVQYFFYFFLISTCLPAYRVLQYSVYSVYSMLQYSGWQQNKGLQPCTPHKKFRKELIFSDSFFVPRNVNAVSFCNLSWLYVSIFANSFAHKVINLHFLALHIPKTKSEIFPDVKWISC
jgi:hypothetical protein